MSFSRGLRRYLGLFFLTMFVKHFTSIFFLFLLIVQEQLDTLKAFLFYGINNSQNIILFVQPQTHSWAQGDNDFLCPVIHLGLFTSLVTALFFFLPPSCTHWGHLCLYPHDIKFSSSANSVRKTFHLVLFILWDLHHLCMDAEFADLLSLPFTLGVTHWSTLSLKCTHLNSPRAELPTSVISQPQLLQPSVPTRCSLSLDNRIWTESWTIFFHKNSK